MTTESGDYPVDNVIRAGLRPTRAAMWGALGALLLVVAFIAGRGSGGEQSDDAWSGGQQADAGALTSSAEAAIAPPISAPPVGVDTLPPATIPPPTPPPTLPPVATATPSTAPPPPTPSSAAAATAATAVTPPPADWGTAAAGGGAGAAAGATTGASSTGGATGGSAGGSAATAASDSTVAATAPPTTEERGRDVFGGNSEEDKVMPDVVCMGLQEAQDEIQDHGVVFSKSEDATGKGRRQLRDSNWIVVRQKPEAGSKVGNFDAVLYVVKAEEEYSC